MRVVHPMPESVWRHNKKKAREGYRHMPYIHRVEDEQLDAVTAGKTFEAKFIRRIGERRGGKWNRPMDSFITLDTFSIGLAHKTHSGFTDELAEFVTKNPELASWAWGPEGSAALMDEDFLHEHMPRRTASAAPGDLLSDPDYPKQNWRRWDFPSWWKEEWDWFVAGWYEIARHPTTMKWYINEVLNKPRWAAKKARKFGFVKASTVGALARHANSYGNSGTNKRLIKSIDAVGYPDQASEDDVMDHLYSPGMYHKRGEAKRLATIREDFKDVSFPHVVSADNLDYSGPIKRIDGTVPRFVSLSLDPEIGICPPPLSEVEIAQAPSDYDGDKGGGCGG